MNLQDPYAVSHTEVMQYDVTERTCFCKIYNLPESSYNHSCQNEILFSFYNLNKTMAIQLVTLLKICSLLLWLDRLHRLSVTSMAFQTWEPRPHICISRQPVFQYIKAITC